MGFGQQLTRSRAAIRQEEDYMAIRRPVAADVMERYGDSLLLSTQFYSQRQRCCESRHVQDVF